jgi:hypothetical protein
VGSDWQPASGRSWVFLVGPLVDRKSRVAAHWDRSSIEQWTRGGGYWLDKACQGRAWVPMAGRGVDGRWWIFLSGGLRQENP